MNSVCASPSDGFPGVPEGEVRPRAIAPARAAWSVVDDPGQWAAFTEPVRGDAARLRSSLVVTGMSCAACAMRVEGGLRAIPGVLDAEVSAASGRASILWDPELTLPSQWMDAVHRLGYEALPANDMRARAQRLRDGRMALWRWLVAGLCMMQVMMYAYPAYSAQPGDLSAEMEHLLRWASWVLTLPVILFSCGPFFRDAARDVAQGRIGMDLPVSLGVAITFAVSSAGTFSPQGTFGHEVYFDSLTMFVFFLLTGRWLEVRLRDRTAGALEAAMNRLPDVVQRVLPDGGHENVVPEQLRIGDTVRVLPGQAFAADGVILRGQTSVDEALLTGESRPVSKHSGAQVVAGSHNLASPVLVTVERVGKQTRFAQIVALMQNAATTKPRLALLADRMAQPFLWMVLLAAAAAGALWWGQDPERALMVAVAVLIVTCPCALSLATPAALLASAGNLARRGVLVRRLQALESLAGVDSVVFDKTGTLTRDVLQAKLADVRPDSTAGDVLAMASALARLSLHPVARAVAAVEPAAGAMPWVAADVQEHPGQGMTAHMARVDALSRPRLLRMGSAAYCGVAAGGRAATYLSDEHGWLATFEVGQQLREDALPAAAALARDGVQVHLLSGDDDQPVAEVARQLGIAHARSGCTPDDKLAYLRDLRAAGRRVAMVGDGINDAPVLAAADVSFAFGRAVPLLQSQVDFVAPGVQLSAVVQTLHLARRTMRIVRQNLGWALAYNLVCIPLAVAGWLPAWLAGLGMAASSLLVVLNALRLSRALPPLGDA